MCIRDSTRPTEEYCEECGASRPCNDDIYFEKCEDHKVCHIGDTVMEGQGRILDLTMCLKNVCPGKRVAVGIALSELDPRGNEYPRGMKDVYKRQPPSVHRWRPYNLWQ